MMLILGRQQRPRLPSPMSSSLPGQLISYSNLIFSSHVNNSIRRNDMDRHFRGMSLSESRALANVKIAINLSYVSSYVLFVILHFSFYKCHFIFFSYC